jgi:acetyl/propionyl-CoA carboxylase alpha subunit
MIAKLIATGVDRSAALSELRDAVRRSIVAGLPTNLPWLLNLLDNDDVRQGKATTRTASQVDPHLPVRFPAIVGGLVHALSRRPGEARDAATAIGAWRLAGWAPLALHGDDWEAAVRLSRRGRAWFVEIDGKSLELSWRDEDGVTAIRAGEREFDLALIERDSVLEVCGEGGRWFVRTGHRPARSSSRFERAHDGRLRAPLPAKVLAVHAQTGDRVERGQPLVTLTAMKIEMICEAPVAGTIESIACAAGDQVVADQILLTITLETS